MAGADSATRPVMSLEDMMAEILSQITATMNAEEVQTTVDDWFNSQGFLLADASQYRSFTMGEGVELSVPTAASDRGFAEALGAAFKFVLANDETIGLSQETRVALAQDGALGLQTAQNDITQFRGRQGVLQERLEDQKNHLSGETAAYEIMRNEITEVDQYEAAVRLQTAQDQLDMLFTLTARMSRLSLTEHL
jgi:flagellar hook-associated protein 3 FlgL